ncbi:HK97 gp10 family phage protein [Paenibacillus sp. DS2015]|uniref:HK97-gp10 family putative phage morphogenesis protein n=1 Tax=Paenibacillus sp. DS2015 TaxID=3373917 RepID=UPI003D241F52
MGNGSVELLGVEQMLAEIRSRLNAGAERIENKALREGGEMFAEAQRAKVPYDQSGSGRHIRDDIKVSGVRRDDGIKFVVIGPGKKTGWRSHFYEFGTAKMSARPFIYPSFHENKARVGQFIADEFRKGLNNG